MSTALLTALIAAVTSLIVSAAGYYFQQREVRKRLDRMFTDRLYNMRLECYPPAFDITDRIIHRPKPEEINSRDELLEIRNDLIKWKMGVVNIAISGNSLNAYRNLIQSLVMGYGLQDQYTETQINKIFDCRDRLRRSLRADLGLLYKEERPKNIIQLTKNKLSS